MKKINKIYEKHIFCWKYKNSYKHYWICHIFLGGPISWYSEKQPVVVTLNTGAECIAAAEWGPTSISPIFVHFQKISDILLHFYHFH